VAVFARKGRYDRSRLMARAAGARRRRRRKKAISLYRQVLAVEPEDPDVHRKIAPLLAQTRQPGEAWASYRKAASNLVRRGFVDQAIGVYREAARYLPRETDVWLAVAELQMKRGRRPDAIAALREGRRHFRGKAQRPRAILLLLQARKLDPHDFATSYDLACLLARAGGRARALRLLDELATRSHRHQLRRVRGRQLLLAPGPGAVGRWLRACVLGR
jgi:tetratricopeptide (TPR) repeat protein